MSKNQKSLQELREELEQIKSTTIQFGFQCNEISAEIQKTTGKRVSSQTLRRVCGLLPYAGQLRGFTYSAIQEYIQIQKANLNKSKEVPAIDTASALQLLVTMADQWELYPYEVQKKLHLRLLQFLYRNMAALEWGLLEVLPNKNIFQLWWLNLPPIDGLSSYTLTWIQPLSSLHLSPEKQIVMRSLSFQSAWLQNKKNYLSIPFQDFQENQITQWNAHSRGRFYALSAWNHHINSDEHSLHRYMEILLSKWKREELAFCPVIQWHMVEALALMKQFDWANTILQTTTHREKNYTLYSSIDSILAFWKMLLGLISDQKSLKNQHQFSEFESNLFFAPHFYELLFTQVMRKSKYLRDFHKERYDNRADDLIEKTGFVQLAHWP
jgi:hypothetical protein